MNRKMTLTLALILASAGTGCQQSSPPAEAHSRHPGTRVAVTVDGQGYHPATVTVPAGRPATVVFTRTSDEGCGQQVVFPSLNLRRDLPLNQPVEVALPAQHAWTIAFTCGMNMMRGTVVAQ